LETAYDEEISYDSDKDIDTDMYKDSANASWANGSQGHVWSRSQDTWNSGNVHPSIGDLSGLRIQEAPHVKKASTSITIFLLFSMEVIQMLVTD
jgi:hypothetical protein